MDSLQFSPNNYADDKAPRTPSPPTASPHHPNYKPDLDPVRIFSQDDDQYQWAAPHHQPRPSLLQELYDSDSAALSPEQHPSPPDMYVDPQDNWPPAPSQRPAHDYTLIRRATFPYARQERPDELAQYPPFLHHPDPHGPSSGGYDAMPLSAEPSALHGHSSHAADNGGYSPPGYPAPQDGPPYEGGVKVEGHEHHHLGAHYAHRGEYPPPPQQQQQFYRPMHHGGYPQHMQQQQHHMSPAMHPHAHHPAMHHPHNGMHLGGGHNVGYPPHGLPVQHTDDAASKETQYLRRRCYNCHTTEPPSWRRSTLNPGKIVCNKCGLYERTHLRARPLRFDELRAGNKARKGAKVNGSPKQQKKVGGGAVQRRSSVSSTGSSVQSGSGASDWDDSGSVYSNTSNTNPPSSFNSPAFSPHPPSLSLSHSHSHPSSSSSHSSHSGSSPRRDSLSRSPPLLGPGAGSPHLLGSPPHSAGFLGGGIGGSGFGSHAHGHPHAHAGNGIRLPHAPDIPTLGTNSPHMAMGHLGGGGGMRTKPRSNTTGGLGLGLHNGGGGGQGGQGGYYSPQPNGHTLHHSSSNSSLHSQHSQHSSSPAMHAAAALHPDAEGGLYRRGSMPDMHLGGGGGVGGAGWEELGMGGVSVKEEPRAVLV
ncbi:hypothetical protein C8F04DRAFT_1174630 [Mycena alexandri]|uniref:GATA-type domain-containing protein n=1 Tax=Mycena alexandri TaxID=1745969 RepID=A0AAD6TFS6_9AGAR|nr:hypothetical protein C8F04DRAFT_1174630 [Mycena alexandri]